MSKNKCLMVLTILLVLLTACSGPSSSSPDSDESTVTETVIQHNMKIGRQSGMHERHMATIPAEYSGMLNPFPSENESVLRGEKIYNTNCTSCHGDSGMGDGPAGSSLTPQAAPLAHTSLRMGDEYLYWRIAEGGLQAPFNSAMPTWKDILSEEDTWDVINYVRALGRGEIEISGADATQFENEQRAAMLSEAVSSGLINDQEAEIFNTVHEQVDSEIMALSEKGFTGRMEDIQDEILSSLIQSEKITEEQSKIFIDVHDRLVEAGLMQ